MKVTMKANFPQAIADINAWSRDKVLRVKNAVNESAINIQTGAKRRCSVNTGRLRSSIAIEPASGDYTVKVGTKVFYAPYVEWGTGVFSEHPDYSGRTTPWAFPVPKTGRTRYNFKRIEVEGKSFYLTKGSKPHPFLLPAAEEERPNFNSNVRRALQ